MELGKVPSSTEKGKDRKKPKEEDREKRTIVLLCLVYTYFLFLSFSVIARCFVSFILVQFFFTFVFMLQFCL